MASTRGRGYGRGASSDSPNAQILRRPGEAGLIQRLESLSSETVSETVDISNEVSDICDKLMKMNLSLNVDLGPLADRMKALCHSVEDMEKCIDSIFKFAVQSKWNAHASALFCGAIGDLIVDEAKFRTHLLRKLQAVYNERNKKYMNLDSFLMDATFLCEVFHHIRIDGKCLKILSRPVIDYFGMLVDGASQKEVEIFVEQFPKCYHSLKENDPNALSLLLCKVRKQIICETSCITVRAMLMEMFELSLMNFKPLNENAKHQYQSLSKPVVRICE